MHFGRKKRSDRAQSGSSETTSSPPSPNQDNEGQLLAASPSSTTNRRLFGVCGGAHSSPPEAAANSEPPRQQSAQELADLRKRREERFRKPRRSQTQLSNASSSRDGLRASIHSSSSQNHATSSAAGPSTSESAPVTEPQPGPSSGATANTPPPSRRKSKKQPSRFSLRRLFYNNPLLAQPFLQAVNLNPPGFPGPSSSSSGPPPQPNSTLAGTSQRSRRYRRSTGSRQDPDTVSERSSNAFWKDNGSACSSIGAGTTIGPDGKPVRECPLCLNMTTLENFPALKNCHHIFCEDCLKVYTKIELQEGRVNIRCPQCVEPLHPNDIEAFIGDKNSNLNKLYEVLMLRRVLASDPDTRWCPGPNCTFAVIASGCASCPRITCERPGCGFSFCYHCKAEWHPNQTCDMARAQRQPQPNLRSSSASFSQDSTMHASEVKVCPRCDVLIVKMDDGSCNHMTCAVCGAEFCWLCMREISDLHYLSPSGCTFWGKKPWSRKKKLMWQLGTLVGAPVGIALLAGISIPAMIIGIPVWVGRKLHSHLSKANKHKRNIVITVGVTSSILVAPLIAGLTVSIGVPILLAYVYGVVPISLCRSEGCGVSTGTNGGVKIDVDEDMPYRPMVVDGYSGGNQNGQGVANPSIGEMSLGASLSMGSGCHLDDHVGSEADRESASNTAMAGTSRTVSLASSNILGTGSRGGVSFNCSGGGVHPHNHRLEVDVHSRKKYSMSNELLADSASLSDKSAVVSLMDANHDNASTKALAGSILAYRMGGGYCSHVSAYGADSQSINSVKTTAGEVSASGDEISLRSLPVNAFLAHNPALNSGSNQRSLSPSVSVSGDDNASFGGAIRKSTRRRAPLEKQMSENGSLLSVDDVNSERVRFDDNVSFIDERCSASSLSGIINSGNTMEETFEGANSGLFGGKIQKGMKSDKLSVASVSSTVMVPEETPEELALVISPEPTLKSFSLFDSKPSIPVSPSPAKSNVTRLSISGGNVGALGTSSSASFPAPTSAAGPSAGNNVTTLEVFSDASGVTTAATPTKGALSPENYV